MSNTMYRITTKNGEIRAFMADTKEMVKEAALLHDVTPVVGAAFGRLLTAASIMGTMLKNDKDTINIQINGDGPMKGLVAFSDAKGYVKGYVKNPFVVIPQKENGKLDVAKAVGKGTLTIVKDLGLREPSVGTIELVSGEIAEDIAYYFATSEQTPSVVALGVLTDKEEIIKYSGGFVIQLLPNASEETISKLEENLAKFTSITLKFREGYSAKEIIEEVLEGFEPEIIETTEVGYRCNCSRERVEKALISIGKKDLQEIVDDDDEKPVEMKCHFCNRNYEFSKEYIATMLQKM